MMLFRSLRWRFQLFYGLLLFAVLVGFSVTGYSLQRTKMFREVDEELRHRLDALALRAAPPPPGPHGGPDGRRGGPPGGRNQPGGPGNDGPWRGERRGGRGEDFRPNPDDPRPEPPRPPEDQRPDAGPPGEFRRGPRPEEPRRAGPPPPPEAPPPRRDPVADRRELVNDLRDGTVFDEMDAVTYYAAAWFRNGPRDIATPNAPPDVPRPNSGDTPVRQRDLWRETSLFTSPGDCLLVGRDIGPQVAELRRFAWLLAAAASGVFGLVTLGGWWLAGRALRPVAEISSAAVKIAAGNLAERIPAAETGNELGQLATVLNSTFARLEAAFAQQQQFTSDAAHELRTPLAVILSQVQTALARERPAEEYREALEASQRAAQRMRRLIDSLLQLTRLDAGQDGLDICSFDLGEIGGECLEMVRPLAKERGIALVTDLRVTQAQGDPDRIGQVVTNLLNNAIQHTPPAGNVVLSVAASRGAAELSVSDTGMGISPDDLPHIFDRFYRADRARSRPDGRTGLGLAISKAIVEAHGGSITVESSAAGSAFTVRIPLADSGLGLPAGDSASEDASAAAPGALALGEAES